MGIWPKSPTEAEVIAMADKFAKVVSDSRKDVRDASEFTDLAAATFYAWSCVPAVTSDVLRSRMTAALKKLGYSKPKSMRFWK